MKRVLFTCFLLLLFLNSFSQEGGEKQKIKSNAYEMLTRKGLFVTISTYDLGGADNVMYEVRIINDILGNLTIGCLNLSVTSSTGTSRYSGWKTYSGMIDYDEIDACIQSLTYMKEVIINEEPVINKKSRYSFLDASVETKYITENGVVLGVFYDKKKNNWKFFIEADKNVPNSLKTMDVSTIGDVIEIFSYAKGLIQEKIE